MKFNFNIKPSDARYIINEDKKVVVCIVENTENLFRDFVDNNFRLGTHCDFPNHGRRLNLSLSMPNRFIGIARCSKDDEWSPELGKLIAFSRAKDNINTSFFKRANTYVNFIDKHLNIAVDTFNSLGQKLSKNTEHRHNLINTLLEDTEK